MFVTTQCESVPCSSDATTEKLGWSQLLSCQPPFFSVKPSTTASACRSQTMR